MVKPARTKALRAWLDDGGMQRVAEQMGLAQYDAAGLPADQAVMGGDGKVDAPPPAKPLPTPKRPGDSRRKAYARQLCKVIARYATDEEARLLTSALEDVSAAILSCRHCPGLNAASYEAFAAYGLQGGAQ